MPLKFDLDLFCLKLIFVQALRACDSLNIEFFTKQVKYSESA